MPGRSSSSGRRRSRNLKYSWKVFSDDFDFGEASLIHRDAFGAYSKNSMSKRFRSLFVLVGCRRVGVCLRLAVITLIGASFLDKSRVRAIGQGVNKAIMLDEILIVRIKLR